MSDLNKVIVIGRLTKDPELKQVGGSQLVNFSIATNRKYKSNNQPKEEVSFFDCEAWGRLAEVINQYANKGTKVAIDGRLRQNTWDTPEGRKASKISIHVESLQLLGGGQQHGQQNQGYNQYGQQQNTPDPAPVYSPTPPPDDEVIF